MTASRVGTLGSSCRAGVDARGLVTPEGARVALDWWIGAEDRRHLPAREASVRQRRPGIAPVFETAMRVPGGDAIQRVYGAGGPAGLVVIEIENASPVPFAAALVVCPRAGGRVPRTTTVAGNWLLVDGRPVVVLPRPPLRRDTDDGDALVYPVAHRTRLRFGLALDDGHDVASHDPGRVPDADEVARGWEAQLGRGMRVVLPDPVLQAAVDAARADLLLASVDATTVAALEDWGFDAEVRAAWPRLSFLARRRASRRPAALGWNAVSAARSEGGTAFLLALRRLLVRESDGGGIDVLGEVPPEWIGHGIEVHDAPTRYGPVSYAVRWHGPRPALLWECEGGGRLRAPGLDPEWATDEPRGEVLLSRHLPGNARGE